MQRRKFLKLSGGAALGFSLRPLFDARADDFGELFGISLAEWSLNKTLRSGKMDNLDFPRVARREFQIDCIEFVDQFFADKASDPAYLRELKQRAGDEGVTMGVIMIDTTGDLGATDKDARTQAVERTFPWIDAAQFLGCRTVRVNARGPGNADELRERVAESCARLSDFAMSRNVNLAIENHGGLSSDPDWLVSVMRQVNRPNFGTLPDFGNFPDSINRYDAVESLMDFAKAVSAKASRFTPEGLVAETDYFRMMRIVRDAGYRGYVGVESGAPTQDGEADAIRKTRDLLIRVRQDQSRLKQIFNGKDLDGWSKIEGGEWFVEDGMLVGRNGVNWSTNPEKSGSWLSSQRQYGDFKLELQFKIGPRTNSGIFFRSSHERNPAFTGYEIQIYDAKDSPPSKSGPGSIYDVMAPTKNAIREAGRWNSVTITARGPKVAVELNGERIIDAELPRALRGYIGLQNHDERSNVRFRNVRIEEL
ncbi:MAG: DUF1080 domain-containing protein [Verrucomicrobia bacterium]|nr:DUF1080 domain-containing protein [Verrucomicrobiota bacterium]